jgi:hypothetical protein
MILAQLESLCQPTMHSLILEASHLVHPPNKLAPKAVPLFRT